MPATIDLVAMNLVGKSEDEMQSHIWACHDEIRALRSDIERYEAANSIVQALPTTADGVPVAPGEEVRRDKWAVTRRLEIEYRKLWCEEGDLMTDTMRAALRVLRAFGKRDFALLAGKSTVRAMMKRGIIDGAFDILAKNRRVDPLHDPDREKRYRTQTK